MLSATRVDSDTDKGRANIDRILREAK